MSNHNSQNDYGSTHIGEFIFLLVIVVAMMFGGFFVFNKIIDNANEKERLAQVNALEKGISTTALVVDTKNVHTGGRGNNRAYYIELYLNETKETISKKTTHELQSQVKQGDTIDVVLIDKDSKEKYEINNEIVIESDNIFLGNLKDQEQTIHISKQKEN